MTNLIRYECIRRNVGYGYIRSASLKTDVEIGKITTSEKMEN